MSLRSPIGTTDFATIRRSGLTYVDKSSLIVDLLEEGASIVLLPRPRRFGKTTNLSMLRYFFERPPEGEDRSDVFSGLAVWGAPAAREHFQRYPVVALTLKEIKPQRWAEALSSLRELVAECFAQHRWLLDHSSTSREERGLVESFLTRQATPEQLARSLLTLTRMLHRATGERVVLLLDEYDTPIHAGWLSDYYDDAIAFFRVFLGAVLKDNPALFKGVLTGILRIARESVFSDLNNLRVYTLLSHRYASAFGFTEAEVIALAEQAGLVDSLPGIRKWYNGYLFGEQVVYNPWSVLCYLSAPEDGFQPYWANTASTETLERLIATGEPALSRDVEDLLAGRAIEHMLDENLVLRDVTQTPEALWSLMLLSGYLKALTVSRDAPQVATLAVPNAEVRTIWQRLFRDWMSRRVGGEGVRPLLEAMLQGEEEAFAGRLQELVLRGLSFLDLDRRQPERVYHAFVLGMLVHLERDYSVWSNPESGYGRADVLVIPKRPGQAGVALEFKRLGEDQSAEQALELAMTQLTARDYAARLREAGADPIHLWAIAFDGKRVRVRLG